MPPMKQSKTSVLTFEMMYAMLLQVIILLMGIYRQLFWGQAVLQTHVTESACYRTTVDGKWNEELTAR
jgi:hypothetical protein